MPRRLPPLSHLRAFEAAARHLSFTKAGDELHVTQAAISHQVKQLEAELGMKLFRRLPRALLLTDEGQALLPELREAFDRLAQAVDRLGGGATRGLLAVSLLTTFAMSWLVPRLPRFQERYKDIEVRLVTSPHLVDFAREDIDVAIRFGRGTWPGLRCDKLFDDAVAPLHGRAFLGKLEHPRDLLTAPLLMQYDDPAEWPQWFREAGLGEGVPKAAAQFDSTRIAVEAAIGGMGIAIGTPFMYGEAIAAGRLFQPFDLTVRSGKGYYVVSPLATAERPKIKAFREWLLEEAALTSAARPTRTSNRGGRAAAASPRSRKAGRAPGRDDASGG
jgi:DNA-binding transcriptional LysR family regulator